jgi:hypothetical protein
MQAMSQRGNHLRKEIAAELERMGIKGEFGMTRGNHQYCLVLIGARQRKFFFPLTPGSTFAVKQAVGGVRRLVRGAQQ